MPYGTSWCTSVMSFSRIVSPILNARSRSVIMPSGELLRPDRQVREDLLDEPLEVVAGARRDRQELRERFARQLVERGQQCRLARQRVHLVQNQERALELAFEHLDERVVLARRAIRLDDEQRHVAILERLMDLARHEPMQRALRAPRVARRVDEHGLIVAAIENAEHALARRAACR